MSGGITKRVRRDIPDDGGSHWRVERKPAGRSSRYVSVMWERKSTACRMGDGGI